jgi:hypothetical protein
MTTPPPDRATPDGTAIDGATRDGVTRDSVTRDSVTRDGATREGTGRYAATRNALMGVGVFYVSRWIAALLQAAVTPVVEGVMSADGVRQALLTPFVSSLSHALAAASAGAVVVLLADAPATAARWRWAMVPAALWFVRSLDEVTISAPGWIHLVTQIIAASLPSIVCLAAGHLADWHRSR